MDNSQKKIEGEIYSPNFVQILPELHLSRIRANLGQIPPEEHLPALNLRTIFIEILINGSFIGCISRMEGSGSDIGFEEFLIDDVDNGGDQGFDVLGARGEGFDVI